MNILEHIAASLRRSSVRLLSLAIVLEITGATAIHRRWPRFWPLGVVLLAVAATHLWSLALRFRETATGPAAAVYRGIQWASLASAMIALAFLAFGLLALLLGSGWV